MVHRPLTVRRLCEICGKDIPEARLEALPDARTCVPCQQRLNRCGADEVRVPAGRRSGPTPASAGRRTVQVEGAQVVVGRWSGNLMDVVAQGGELRHLLRAGEKARARALVQAMPVEAQAALVAMDEDPEGMLSLTGMDGSNRPAYSTPVVDLLPSETLSGLISVNPEERTFNTELIRAMSPQTLGRMMAEGLAPIDNPAARSRVSWEWLRALAQVGDANRLAELLRGMDPALLEEAVLDRLEDLDLHGTALEVTLEEGDFSVEQFRLFSEEAETSVKLGDYIEDAETRDVIGALSEAAPDLMRHIVRMAWEVSGGGGWRGSKRRGMRREENGGGEEA